MLSDEAARKAVWRKTSRTVWCGRVWRNPDLYPTIQYSWEFPLNDEHISWKDPSRDTKGGCAHRIIQFDPRKGVIRRFEFESFEEAESTIDRFVGFYNNEGLHSTIGYITPGEMNKKCMERIQKAWNLKRQYCLQSSGSPENVSKPKKWLSGLSLRLAHIASDPPLYTPNSK